MSDQPIAYDLPGIGDYGHTLATISAELDNVIQSATASSTAWRSTSQRPVNISGWWRPVSSTPVGMTLRLMDNREYPRGGRETVETGRGRLGDQPFGGAVSKAVSQVGYGLHPTHSGSRLRCFPIQECPH